MLLGLGTGVFPYYLTLLCRIIYSILSLLAFHPFKPLCYMLGKKF